MARKSGRSRRDAAPARGRTMNVDRPTDRDAPISKSLLVIRHNQFGYPYFSYCPDLGPGEYTPNMLPSVDTV